MSAREGQIGKATCLRESDAAILVRREEDGDEMWLAKSVLDEESEVKKAGDHGVLVVEPWAAELVGWSDRRAYSRKRA